MRNLPIEIRHRRLRGGRLSISSGTGDPRKRDRAVADIRTLIERGDFDLVERLRAGDIVLGDLRRAVRTGDYDALRRAGTEVPRLGPALDRLLEKVESAGVEGTAKEYRTLRNLLLGSFDGDRELSTVTSEDARRFLQEPKATNPDPETGAARPWSIGRQNVIRTLAARLWNDEIRLEAEHAELAKAAPRLRRNPWSAADIPKPVPTRFAFLRPPEWRTLIESVRGQPQAAFLALGCLAGLRMGETLHLRTNLDVDLARRVVHIQSRPGPKGIRWRPKSPRRGQRDIPMTEALYRILSEHAESGYAGERYFIVLPYRDKPISLPTGQKWTRRAFEAVGLQYGRQGEGLTYHSLRHTFASWLVQQDQQLKKVAKLMGDRTEQVDRTYSHLLPSDLERTVGVLDAILEAA